MSLFFSLVYLFNLTYWAQSTSACPNSGQISETDIRRMASETHLPSYPEDAKKNQITGIAVIEMRLNTANKIDWTKVIEAPSKSIAEATTASVHRWRFPSPRPGDTPICVRGKLTFYFVIENGIAKVRNPKRYEAGR